MTDMEARENRQVLRILLLTNKDSDNLGDWIIETCDLALIDLVMENLGIAKDRYYIQSHAAGWIVPQKYLDTRKRKYLVPGRERIGRADLVIFGGAPMFNFKYQDFFEKTATIIELARAAQIPVIFSAVGVEKYDGENEKCRRIAGALQKKCVKQITTRDDLVSLEKYAEGRKIPIGKVADPAVYTAEVFRRFIPRAEQETVQEFREETEQGTVHKRIGLFVLRAGGFSQNAGGMQRDEAALFWKQLVKQLKSRGYDYTLLGSGNYGDEAFLDDLIRRYGIPVERCRFNIASPEELVQTVASFDAVVSCRLHPSILSYSLGVPSVGIEWNAKVSQFYESIGCGDRVFSADEADPVSVADRIEEIIGVPAQIDEMYRYTVYRSLFDGIGKRAVVRKFMPSAGKTDQIEAYTPEEVAAKLPDFGGTNEERLAWYRKRKSRRTYEELNRLKRKRESFILILNSGREDCDPQRCTYDKACGIYKVLPSGRLEYRLQERWPNSGQKPLQKIGFVCDGGAIEGWHIRIKNAGVWYWYLVGGVLCPINVWKKEKDRQKVLVEDGAPLPVFALESLDAVVLEAVWQPAASHENPTDSIEAAPTAAPDAAPSTVPVGAV